MLCLMHTMNHIPSPSAIIWLYHLDFLYNGIYLMNPQMEHKNITISCISHDQKYIITSPHHMRSDVTQAAPYTITTGQTDNKNVTINKNYIYCICTSSHTQLHRYDNQSSNDTSTARKLHVLSSVFSILYAESQLYYLLS